MESQSFQEFRSFQEFWPYYVLQHAKRATRFWHGVGTTFVFLFLLAAIWSHRYWLLLLIPVAAYGCAWFSHFAIEKNKPATFGHPFWSLRGDFQMYFYMLSGRMREEVRQIETIARG